MTEASTAPELVSTLSGLARALSAEGKLADRVVARAHPLIVTIHADSSLILLAPAAVWDRGRELLRPFAGKLADGEALLILLGRPDEADLARAQKRGLAAIISANPSIQELLLAIQSGFDLLDAKARAESRGKWLNRYRYELGELMEIAKAITTEREVDKLLDLILAKSRYITGADAGSLYVVEGDHPDPLQRLLRFKLSQNDSVSFDASEFTMPVSPRSMSGYVALHRRALNIPDVYDLPAHAPYGFDRRFDEKIAYRTKSMLCAPLLSRDGEVIGVLQLINRKRDPNLRLRAESDVETDIVAFDERCEEIVATLASQAGIALENALLNNEIQRMLEGFVRASVEAIEQRDPTTSGHSRRVADLTLGLARALERCDDGPYKRTAWTADQLRELEYASLLHDFGKIGVREQVLVKAKKLYPHELDTIRARFDVAFRSVEVDVLSRKLAAVHAGASLSSLEDLDRELVERRTSLAAALDAVLSANEPTVLSSGDFQRIETIAHDTYLDLLGNRIPLLSPAELTSLSVPRGSLTKTEIEEIQSHVVLTYEFLSRIPWGKQFRRVASIAGSHHERLDGTGYPGKLSGADIPLQSKLMSVSDIFDALTASDRPYKKAVPLTKALDILAMEVKANHIDGELLRVFNEAKVWSVVDLRE
jgi:HD-GYP domain-containing protein (c-di-GMP phosphodiesterase class II)